MKRNILILGAIGMTSLVGWVAWYVCTQPQKGHDVPQGSLQDNCVGIDIELIKQSAQNIESGKSTYASTTRKILGMSTEGGHQTNFYSGNSIVLKEQMFFGETGKAEASYYVQNGNVFYIRKTNYEYARPLYEDTSGLVKTTTTKDFYFDKEQHLCYWYIDGKLQANDKDTFVLVQYLISNS